MKTSLPRLIALLLLLAVTVTAAQQAETADPGVIERRFEGVARELTPKSTDIAERIDERIRELEAAAAEIEKAEAEEADTGEKIEKATEEVGKALGPVGEILDWFSSLPGYWEAFLVGGGVFIVLSLLYFFIQLGVKRIMRKQKRPDWHLARRYSLFIRIIILSISALIALVWVGETEGWLYEVATGVTSMATAFLAINVFSYLVLEKGRKKRNRKPIPVLFQQVIRAVLYVIAILTVLGASFELDLSALLASSAMLSLVLGLALQDTLGNIFAGMSIHGSKPFEIGDWIRVKDYEGQVVEMNWREVRLRTFEQDNIVLPNSIIASSDFVNYSHPTGRRLITLEIGTSYADPPDKVRRVIRRVLENIDEIEPARDHLFLVNYNDFSIDYVIRFFLTDYSRSPQLRGEVMNRLWYAFRRAGITIPFPIRDLNIQRPDREAEQVEWERELNRRLELLSGIELFKNLSEDTRVTLAEKLQRQLFSPGEAVVVQGEPGDSFYVICEGSFDVYINKGAKGRKWGIKVGRLDHGDFFGEMSLLTGEERSASVVCAEHGVLYALDKDSFKDILLGHPEISQQLATLASKRVSQNMDQLSKYLDEGEQQGLDDKQKNAHVRKAILSQMRDFFGL